jgi:hypothetical protein
VNERRIKVTGHASDSGVGVTEELGWVLDARALQELARARPGDIDRRERHRPIHDVDPHRPGLRPVADPHLCVRRATGGERQDEPGIALARIIPSSMMWPRSFRSSA